uniref:Uncharacterized protein n=1 Tax=Glossina austeni TaxID=7395 RepID=A0A1A9UGJ9_GLOAU
MNKQPIGQTLNATTTTIITTTTTTTAINRLSFCVYYVYDKPDINVDIAVVVTKLLFIINYIKLLCNSMSALLECSSEMRYGIIHTIDADAEADAYRVEVLCLPLLSETRKERIIGNRYEGSLLQAGRSKPGA